MSNTLSYTPPPTIREFIKYYLPGELFYSWICGPVGSSKTTGLFFKLVYMAKLQAPGPDGIRRTRAVIVRNSMPQLKDTTLASWNTWFHDGQAGTWFATQNKFLLKYNDVECEVLFRPLDTPDDVARVLSLEVTFAIIDEFVQIPRAIVDALSARLGRYPSKVNGGATNYGMWGASNPSTEANWWYNYLHSKLPENAKYFLQPSGFSPDAENLENLPGGRGYYTNQAKGKSEAWIKQFLEAEWGYSADGKPVVPSFKPELHVSRKPLILNPHLPLIVGIDPGLGGSALVFGQEDLTGRLSVLGELVQAGFGAERLMKERLRPYLRNRFPDAHVILAPDPAAAGRTSTDERSVVDVLKKFYEVRVETNNRLPKRLDAIEYYTSRLAEGVPALQIDGNECPHLIRALKGGWRYKLDSTQDGEVVKGAEPDKNQWSHVGDGFGYLCRYFHRGAERASRMAGPSGKVFVPPRVFSPSYHMR